MVEMVWSAMAAPGQVGMTYIIQTGDLQPPFAECSAVYQQACGTFGPSLTSSGCRANATAGGIRITSACSKKTQNLRKSGRRAAIGASITPRADSKSTR
jgi:hypothetical protein